MKKQKTVLNKFMKKFASGELIETVGSEVSQVLEVVRLGDTVMLNSANTNYSFGGLHRVFRKVFKKLDVSVERFEKVMVLGFGTGSIAAILQDEIGIKCNILGIEKDPEVIRLGRKYFNTERYTGLEIIEADAAEYVHSLENTFDLIVVDVYVDFKVPASCESQAFIDDLQNGLNPGGMVLFNKLVYNYEAGEEAEALIRKFEALNGITSVIRVKENLVNRVIVYEDRTPKNEHRKPREKQ